MVFLICFFCICNSSPPSPTQVISKRLRFLRAEFFDFLVPCSYCVRRSSTCQVLYGAAYLKMYLKLARDHVWEAGAQRGRVCQWWCVCVCGGLIRTKGRKQAPWSQDLAITLLITEGTVLCHQTAVSQRNTSGCLSVCVCVFVCLCSCLC